MTVCLTRITIRHLWKRSRRGSDHQISDWISCLCCNSRSSSRNSNNSRRNTSITSITSINNNYFDNNSFRQSESSLLLTSSPSLRHNMPQTVRRNSSSSGQSQRPSLNMRTAAVVCKISRYEAEKMRKNQTELESNQQRAVGFYPSHSSIMIIR